MDKRFTESAWQRGWNDTKHGWGNWCFIGLEAIGAPAAGLITGNAWLTIFLVVFGMFSIWIGATATASTRQRNEARQRLQEVLEPDRPGIVKLTLPVMVAPDRWDSTVTLRPDPSYPDSQPSNLYPCYAYVEWYDEVVSNGVNERQLGVQQVKLQGYGYQGFTLRAWDGPLHVGLIHIDSGIPCLTPTGVLVKGHSYKARLSVTLSQSELTFLNCRIAVGEDRQVTVAAIE